MEQQSILRFGSRSVKSGSLRHLLVNLLIAVRVFGLRKPGDAGKESGRGNPTRRRRATGREAGEERHQHRLRLRRDAQRGEEGSGIACHVQAGRDGLGLVVGLTEGPAGQ